MNSTYNNQPVHISGYNFNANHLLQKTPQKYPQQHFEQVDHEYMQQLYSSEVLVQQNSYGDINSSQQFIDRRRSREATVATSLNKSRKDNRIPFENAYVEDCYKFIVHQGNNSGLIR